jgi:hypothetical protein
LKLCFLNICSDGIFVVFNFTDEWSYISNHFSNKFHPSFESGNSFLKLITDYLITAGAHRSLFTTSAYCEKVRKCKCLSTMWQEDSFIMVPLGIINVSTAYPFLSCVCSVTALCQIYWQCFYHSVFNGSLLSCCICD